MPRKNSKGDTLRIAEVTLTPEDVREPSKGWRIKTVSRAIDERDGSLYWPQVTEQTTAKSLIEKGVITEEEFQTMYSTIAKIYEVNNETDEQGTDNIGTD